MNRSILHFCILIHACRINPDKFLFVKIDKIIYFNFQLFFLHIFLISNEPELGAGIDFGMALNPFPSSILDETSFEPTTF